MNAEPEQFQEEAAKKATSKRPRQPRPTHPAVRQHPILDGMVSENKIDLGAAMQAFGVYTPSRWTEWGPAGRSRDARAREGCTWRECVYVTFCNFDSPQARHEGMDGADLQVPGTYASDCPVPAGLTGAWVQAFVTVNRVPTKPLSVGQVLSDEARTKQLIAWLDSLQ